MTLPDRRDSGIRTFNEQGALNAYLGQLGFDLITSASDVIVAGNGNPALVGVIAEGAVFAEGDLTLTVDDGTEFTDDRWYIIADTVVVLTGGELVIDGEIIKVTNIAGNALTVTRGVGGSTDADHDDGCSIYILEGIPHDGRNGTDLVRQWVRVQLPVQDCIVSITNRLGDDISARELLDGMGIWVTAIKIEMTGGGPIIAYRG